jgi:hypothetical protein
MFSDPMTASGVGEQPIHQLEEDLIIRINFDPHDALNTLILTDFLDQDTPSLLVYDYLA